MPSLDVRPLEYWQKRVPWVDQTGVRYADFGYVMIDWLTVYQVHPYGSLPVVGKTFKVESELETGEIVSQVVTGFQHEGSYDTALRVRCDGSKIEVSGNPSAFSRPDNVFGYQSLQECIAVYNKVLEQLGLPIFNNINKPIKNNESIIKMVDLENKAFLSKSETTKRAFYTVSRNGHSAFSQKQLDYGRPRITAIHITENIFTGSTVNRHGDIISNSDSYLRHLSTYMHRKKPGHLYPNGKTLDWGNDGGKRQLSRIYHKYYDKAHDVYLKIADLLKVKSSNDEHAIYIYSRLDYLSTLYDWCKENGLVRNEVELKSTQLIDDGLIYIENWSYNVMCEIIRPYQFHKKLNIEETRMDSIYDELIKQGVPEGQASKAQLIHTEWVNRKDLSIHLRSSKTYYRYRNLLLRFGFDIATECNISKLPLRVNQVQWKPATVPNWYQLPDVSKVA